MFKKIKEHFEYTKAKKMITIMCLNQYNALLKIQTELETTEKDALDEFKSFSSNMSIDELAEFVNNINNFSKDMENPKTKEDFYETVIKFSDRDNSIPKQC